MSTKVKGEAIKEGSIPLSALATEVKDKIENAGGGADWNAQEGEAGYVENRTHYLYNTTSSNSTLGKGVTKIPYTSFRYALVNDTIIEIPYFEEGLEFFIITGPPIYIKYIYEGSQPYMELTDNYNYFANTAIEFYQRVRQIAPAYIPDTVLKTTPQTLTDTDKNQALANLGIDPVVWKYVWNPYELSDRGGMVPEELRNIIEDENGYLRKIALKLIVIENEGSVFNITNIGYNEITSGRGRLLYSNGYFEEEP